MANSKYEIRKTSGHGQYLIYKTTPGGKVSKRHTTDSQAYDDYQDGKCSQARLKRLYGQ